MADTGDDHSHGPWVDVHAHPGRCFLGGLPSTSPLVQLLGGDESAARVRSSAAGEVSVVATATVADLAVLGVRPDGGLYAERLRTRGGGRGSRTTTRGAVDVGRRRRPPRDGAGAGGHRAVAGARSERVGHL
ncbi:MAG: hypothetical protein R2705_09335 [Ilumatobacteraceae bacterium]